MYVFRKSVLFNAIVSSIDAKDSVAAVYFGLKCSRDKRILSKSIP